MSRRRVAELDDQCLTVSHDPQADPHALQVRPECFEWLRDQGHPVEGVSNLHNAVSVKDEDNSGYIVAEIETLKVPVDAADFVEDKISIWVCSCPGFHYHRFPDLSEGESLAQVGECSHIEKCKPKAESAQNDENQQQLAAGDTQ